MRIALLDYGAGNLTSVRKGFLAAGAELLSPRAPEDLSDCSGVVVPGVGHFGVTAALEAGWREAVLRRVEAGVPLFGICLGMQWLYEGSEEAPEAAGLGLVSGRCERIVAERPLKVPHVGWNRLDAVRPSVLLEEIADHAQVYFTHTFAAPITPDCVASSEHGQAFAAVVERGHVAGVQFHPEKSGDAGIRLLRNFIALTRK
ncbi:MAG: imidazole glycerol phosphate synthase subunit HisH [Acidobacteriota bacterium]|nr:imidazole glycerol phosphate synthase subunit HisH [Acidobacteriota bacterium]